MTTEELNTIVQAVVDKINGQVIDFDVVSSAPESTDLLSAVRSQGDGTYQGVTLKWDDVANAVTREAKGYRDEAASAKINVENMKASVDQTVSDFNTLAEQKKAEVQGVYQTDLDELKGDINNLEIENYDHVNWKSILNEATITQGKFAEKSGDTINIVTNSGYRMYEYDLTGISKVKMNVLNFYNIKLLFLDNDNKILAYYPSERVTTETMTEVIADVPSNASKMVTSITNNLVSRLYAYKYVNEYNMTADMMEKMSSISKSSLEKQITVNVNTNETLDTTIITKVGNTIRQKSQVFNNTNQPNSAILPRTCEVYMDGKWKTIVNNEDDNCPVELKSGYIGAGHGYDRAYILTLENHGKTYADIGSEWKDTSNISWFIVRIIDENNFVVIGQNADNNYDTISSTNTGILTHVSGAVNTDSISGYRRSIYLIAPIDKNHVKKILLDGVSEVSGNGSFKANNYVDLIDEYDIINPQTIVPQIQENKPSGGYTENPDINTGNTFLHFSNIYRFLADGTMLVITTLDNDCDISLSNWGGTQYAQKSSMSAFGGGLFRYVPKVLPIDGHDLRTPVNMSSWNFTVNADKAYWENPDSPPDRLLHLYTDGTGKYKAGFAVGYLPFAEGTPSVRKRNISNAMFLYKTMKAYFHLVDNGGENGNMWSAYTPFQSVVYRKPIFDLSNKHTSAYFVPNGDKCYMYADYHSVCDDRIKVPSEYVGKPMKVLEKSDNVSVYGSITTDEIRVRVTTSSPMYGYAVVEIG